MELKFFAKKSKRRNEKFHSEILPMKLLFVSFQYLDWLPRYKDSKCP